MPAASAPSTVEASLRIHVSSLAPFAFEFLSRFRTSVWFVAFEASQVRFVSNFQSLAVLCEIAP